jgi:hypothetical protein
MVLATHQSRQSIEPWVFRELGLALFGDARLTARALRLASDLAAHPGLPLSSLYESDWAGLKAGYRFFDNPKVTPAQLLEPHQAATWERAASEHIILIAQDTTYFNFTSHGATTGMGPIGSGTEQGFLLHSALALTTDGVPLGLVDQIAWARDPDTRGKSARRKQLPIEEKESYRWLQIQEQIAGRVPDGTQTVLMGDRESDIYDLFIAPRNPQQQLLVRAAWDRKLEDPLEQHLWAAAEAAPVVGTMTITVPRKPGQPEREATLALRTTAVQMARPAHRSATTPSAPPMTVVLAREIAPPDGMKPIEWLLLTTLAMVTAEDAARIVTWYSYRWRIERLHFTLKTGGSHVEDLQLESRERLERAITLYSIVAWRLLWMTYQVRVDPNQSPTVAFSPAEIAVLERLATTQKPIRPAGQPLTLRDAVRVMAKLGGFLGRKSDGEPGVKTLWRGYRQLQLLCWWDEVPRNPS